MNCFEQSEKNIVYKIEEYDGYDSRWKLQQYSFKNFEEAKEFYDNNSRLDHTKAQTEKGQSSIFRIIEVKTISKPVLTNTKQFKILKNHIIKLRKQGLI